MTIYYSASTGGFYVDSVHGGNVPADCKEIAQDVYAHLFEVQAAGCEIRPGPDGMPVAVEPPAPTAGQMADMARNQRERLLRECDWTALTDVPMAADLRAYWAAYRQDLRDITEQPGFPGAITWPAPPGDPSP